MKLHYTSQMLLAANIDASMMCMEEATALGCLPPPPPPPPPPVPLCRYRHAVLHMLQHPCSHAAMLQAQTGMRTKAWHAAALLG